MLSLHISIHVFIIFVLHVTTLTTDCCTKRSCCILTITECCNPYLLVIKAPRENDTQVEKVEEDDIESIKDNRGNSTTIKRTSLPGEKSVCALLLVDPLQGATELYLSRTASCHR